LRRLAELTGTSFTPAGSKVQASCEITCLARVARGPRADCIGDARAVQSDLQAGAGDSVRHRRCDARGYGSSARWAHASREAER
jgi:hypothetical protein